MSDKVKIYCPDCGGSKRIPTEDPKSFSSYPCPTCRGTGEVESRSVQRREALQKGEPMPQFDKPSYYAPENIDNSLPCGHDAIDISTSDEGASYCKKCEDKPEMPPAEIRAGIDIATGNRHWVPADVSFFPYLTPYTRKDLSLPKDKVRELVRLLLVFDEVNEKDCDEGDKVWNALYLQIESLFPEGVSDDK